MALIDHFELIQKLIRNVESERITDEPMNTLAILYKEGYETAIDNAVNQLRRDL